MKAIFALVILFSSLESSTETESIDYLKKYAGVYAIKYKSIPSASDEAYALHENGKAAWIHEWSPGKTETKHGTWTAGINQMTISIQGNTGILVQKFTMRNGVFTDIEDPNIYLKKQP